MSTHTTRRRARALALATASAMLSATVIAAAAPATATVAATASTATTTTAGSTVLTPTVVPTSAAEIANPMRGQYRWMGYAASPTTWPAPDVYYRDQVYWGRLEATKGTFDFSALDAGLNDAGAKKSKFGFRVMAYCPGCWMNARTDKNVWPSVTPSWMPVDANGVPRWNDATFLSEWEKLWAALGARYAKDPRLGYVDVGGFGKYGEWMSAGDTLTLASAKRIIGAVAKAFPSKHVLLSAVTDYTLYSGSNVLQWGLDTYPNLGVRSDCLGNSYMQKPDGSFVNVWKSRPFFTEWCTNGDPVLALQQVKDYHVSTVSSGNLKLTYSAMTATQRTAYESLLKLSGYRYAVTTANVSAVSPGQPFTVALTVNNAGVAPTYDPWTVRFVLKSSTGTRVATLPMSIDLRTQPSGTVTYTRTLTAPTVATGNYTAAVEVVDPAGYSVPMGLANGSRAADGSYPLGALPLGNVPVQRLAGADRYTTSATVSAATFDPGVPVAYIATGTNFPDALSGGPAGGTRNGPVLLVTPTVIPAAIATELTRLRPARIVILGGTGSISATVATALGRYTSGTVTRLAGADRYTTSATVSAATFAPGVPVAYIATGTNFPDALSGGPAGGTVDGPVLLVTPTSIPTPIATELTRLRPARIVILGGTGSVSTSVGAALTGYVR
ncbi:MAG TPA: cell wall-binding repeat-containing protein [Phycicoccus sp.]|nr:cell wall-binding repeat-containing protein [Phycicoccus sp.]